MPGTDVNLLECLCHVLDLSCVGLDVSEVCEGFGVWVFFDLADEYVLVPGNAHF